jgi:hypothetical protein
LKKLLGRLATISARRDQKFSVLRVFQYLDSHARNRLTNTTTPTM